MPSAMEPQSLDALIVGAGFGGIYQTKKLVDQGLNVKAIDMAEDVGGTWYWNHYPGAMSEYVNPPTPRALSCIVLPSQP